MNTTNTNLTYSFGHIGINTDNENEASKLAQQLKAVFAFPAFDIGGAIFVEGAFEVMKKNFRGKNGHIAIETNDLNLAIEDIQKKGIKLDMDTLQIGEDGKPISVYLVEEMGGFAFHLLQCRASQ